MGFIDRLTGWFAPLAGSMARDGLTSRYADPSSLLTQSFEDFYGTTGAGFAVTRSRAMQLPTIAKIRNTVAGNVGRLPLYTVKNNQRTEHQSPFLAQPERTCPSSTTLAWTVDALMFHRCTWWVVRNRDSYRFPSEVEWIDWGRAGLDSEGRLIAVDGKSVRREDVIRFDSPLGAGLLVDGADVIRRAMVINAAAALAEDNPVPVVELHYEGDEKMPKDEMAEMVKLWTAARRRSGVSYTPKGLNVKTHGIHPEQLLIDGRRAIQLELARAANAPAWIADLSVEGQSLNYQNRQSRNGELIDLALSPYMSAIRDRLSMNDVSPRGWRVLFDTDELTKPDMKDRFAAYALGKKNRFITNDWIAAQEGWSQVAPDGPITEPTERDGEESAA